MYFDIFHTINKCNYHYASFELILVLLIANSVKSSPLERKQQQTNEQNADTTNTLTNAKYNRIFDEHMIQDNWQLPSKFLEKRGYIYDHLPSHEISRAAHNIINGPLLNPVSSSFAYGKPLSQYVHPSNAIIHTRTSNDPDPDEEYIGQEYIDKIGKTWKKWFGAGENTTNTTSTHPPETKNKTLRSVDSDFEKQWLGESSMDTAFSPSDIAFIKCFIGCLKSSESVVDECEKRYLSCSSGSNNDSKRNEQTYNESDATVASHHRYFDTKLRFLANVHHPVDQVGQSSHKHLNLSIISNIIDNVRNGLSFQNANSPPENTCTNRTESIYLLPFVEKKLNKRSDYSDDESNNMQLYHNDYLDASAEDDFEPNNDEESEFFSRRHKHKKNRRKGRKRKKWYNFGRKHRPYNSLAASSPVDNEKESRANSDSDLSDFNDIKFRIHPNQEQDIVKFIKNVNEAPKLFDFNVDDYVVQKTLDETEPIEVVTEKAFYEFIPSSNIASPLLQTGSGSLNDAETNFEKRKNKRDILTQRLKGVANKMIMFPNKSGYYAAKRADDENGSQIFEDESLMENYDEQQFEDESPSNGSNNLNDLDIDMNLEEEFRDFDSITSNHFYPELYNYTGGI